jgi:DNA-binding NtrC family response regulator
MNPINILLVEDSPSDALLLESLLAMDLSLHHTLTVVDHLAAGMELAAKEAFDVILLDMELPDCRGISTFQQMHQAAPRTPTIVLTRKGDMETALTAIQNGAQDFFPKGELTTFILTRTIRYAIERGQLVRELQDALDQIQKLQGLLPICGDCKKVRDDKGYWNEIEAYIHRHSSVRFSHGLCPKCAVRQLEENGLPVTEKLRKAAAKAPQAESV